MTWRAVSNGRPSPAGRSPAGLIAGVGKVAIDESGILMTKREQTGQDQVTLGSYLRSVRESRRMKLREVEDASGVSNAYLSQLETGKIAKPSPHILHKLATVYNIPYDVLMDKAGYLVRAEDEQGGDAPAIRGSRIPTKAIQDLTADEEDAVLKYIEFLRYQRKKD